MARLLTTQGKRRRVDLERADNSPPDPEPRFVRPRRDVLVQTDPPSNAQVHHSAWATDHQDPFLQYFEESFTGSPSLVPLPQLPSNAGPDSEPLSAWKPPTRAIALPRTDGEPIPTLTEVNPESGSVTGGARIWLKGMDFPAVFPLFVRFGTAVVPTVSHKSSPCAPHLIKLLRHSPPVTFLLVICLPQPRLVSSMLRY